MPITIELFYKLLTEISYDFKENRKSLIDVKHELVKQLLKTLREHWYIIVRRPSFIAPAYEYKYTIAPAYEYKYTVGKIWNLEELVIQEELGIEYAKMQQ